MQPPHDPAAVLRELLVAAARAFIAIHYSMSGRTVVERLAYYTKSDLAYE
ncbi:MAG TPA: hypothetical protein VFA59_06595 [Vicinamibacterales bacterium]|nr:hypothetical protein [Vicinamibacterales bacterium]